MAIPAKASINSSIITITSIQPLLNVRLKPAKSSVNSSIITIPSIRPLLNFRTLKIVRKNYCTKSTPPISPVFLNNGVQKCTERPYWVNQNEPKAGK